MVAIGAGAWLGWSHEFGDKPLSATSREPSTESGTALSSSADLRAGGRTVVSAGDEDSAAGRTGGTSSQAARRSAGAFSSSTEANMRSPATADAVPSELDGLSVPEGAEFPIAESIEKECASGKDSDWDCSEILRVLKSIEDEGIDEHWGPSMEGRIRAAVGAASGVRIRSLACRSTVCAVETDGELVTLNTWTALEKDLLTAAYVRAYDYTGKVDASFRVQLWTFTRRR